MNKVRVEPFQSVFDMAIQVYGRADGALAFVKDNGLDDWEVEAGQELSHRSAPLNKKIADWHTATSWTPVSDFDRPEGPDFNFDFNLDHNA